MAASKLKQILQLEPANEIAFQGPFEHVVTSYLELKNPSDKWVTFKVKTTAPKRYCVRPNSGVMDPHGKVKIAIMLQPLDPDTEAEARTKHKFMVQSMILQSDEKDIPLETLWQDATKTKPEIIMDSKLRCVFLSPDQQDGDSFKERKADPAGAGGNTQFNAAATNTTTASQGVQQAEQLARVQRSTVDSQQSELIRTSTPAAASKWGTSSSPSNQNLKFGQSSADKSISSSQHNLTSFMQPMSDDYKVVLVSLVMLVLGVILGKYII